jgi:hypothetical protein
MAFGNGPRIVTSGLVLSLDAGDRNSYVSGSSVWNDVSGNGKTGTLSNGPTFDTTNGGSIVFDGVDDYVAVAGSIILTQATFLLWIKRNGLQVSYTGLMHSRGGTGGNVTGMNVDPSGQQGIGYHWNDTVTTYGWNSGLVIPESWSMIAITVVSTFAIAYLVNQLGLRSATNSVSHASTTLAALSLARDNTGSGRIFKGNIAGGLLYNRALSATEVLQNYNAQKSRFGL